MVFEDERRLQIVTGIFRLYCKGESADGGTFEFARKINRGCGRKHYALTASQIIIRQFLNNFLLFLICNQEAKRCFRCYEFGISNPEQRATQPSHGMARLSSQRLKNSSNEAGASPDNR